MKKRLTFLISIIAVFMIISSCNVPSGQIPLTETQKTAAIVDQQTTLLAAAAQTAQAQNNQLAKQQVTNTPYVITTTPLPTYTALPTYTPGPNSPMQTPVVTGTVCDQAAFINDITIPEGTILSAGESFVKTWRLQNTGTCTWTTDYKAVLDRGDSLSGPSSIILPHKVSPGQVVDLSANMVAPKSSGTYEAFWSLANASGSLFGFGPNHNLPFDVLVVVGTTPSAFAVTHVEMDVSPSSATASCPSGKKFDFSADIVTNAGGTVKYHWKFSDGSTSDSDSITFNDSGDQTVSTSWTLGKTSAVSPNPYNGWARIYIDSPNHQDFPRVDFKITCK